MSWHFSQALVAAFSAGKSSAGELSAPSSMKNMPQVYSSSDKMTAFCLRSRYGMTCEPLTANLGEELLTWFRGAFPAKTSVPQEREPDWMASAAVYGEKWQELLARYDPDSCSWKTPQYSLLVGLESFSETWPKWGSMRNGACFQRQTAVPNICESASGFWQTPVADDAANRANGKWNSRGEPKLSAQVMLEKPWPTPTATLASKGGRVTPRKGREGGTLIEAVSARRWPTPTARDHFPAHTQEYIDAKKAEGHGMSNLNDSVGGQLNPVWVEWLMGWPQGWSGLEPLETAKFHEWQQQHFPSCSEG